MDLLDYVYLCKSTSASHKILDITGLNSSKLNFDTFIPYTKYENKGIYFYTIESAQNSTLYVVIEGTHTFSNIIDDLHMPESYVLPNGVKNGLIQSAWLNMAKKIKELLDPVILDTDKYTNIVFVGHSMGAAIAMILLILYTPRSIKLLFKSYAIALPPFCNNVIVSFIDKYVDFIIFNNGDDPVTKMHLYPSECTYITKNIIWLTPKELSLNLANHCADDYIKNIKLLYKNSALLNQVD